MPWYLRNLISKTNSYVSIPRKSFVRTVYIPSSKEWGVWSSRVMTSSRVRSQVYDSHPGIHWILGIYDNRWHSFLRKRHRSPIQANRRWQQVTQQTKLMLVLTRVKLHYIDKPGVTRFINNISVVVTELLAHSRKNAMSQLLLNHHW